MSKCKICERWIAQGELCYRCKYKLQNDKKFRYNTLYRGKYGVPNPNKILRRL